MGILRFLLAISVVLFHANFSIVGLKLMGGSLAVQMFFIISGFYMSLILKEKYIDKNNSYYLFISNRLLRLLPLYFLILFIIIALNFFLKSQYNYSFSSLSNYESYSLHFSTKLYLFFTQICVIGQDVALFLGLNEDGKLYFLKDFHKSIPELNSFMLIGQGWTISLELYFYLLAPFLLRMKRNMIFIVIGFSILLRFSLSYFLGLKNDPWNYRFFPTELLYFLLGYIGYIMYKAIPNHKTNFYQLILFIFMISFSLFYSSLFDISFISHRFLHIVYVVCFVFCLPYLFNYTKNSIIDRNIGELSYPIYLSHGIILELARFFKIYNGETVIVLIIVFSWIINKLVAIPIEVHRQNRLRK